MSIQTQILLYAVVVTLTILMVIIGWQIYQILGEIRKMFVKFNTMVDSAVTVTGNLGRSLQNINGFTQGLKAVFGMFNVFKKREKAE